MEIEITQAAYGKDGVRVLTQTREGDVHTVRDASFQVRVEGDFLESYRTGENAGILPSDTLRRHALAEADRLPQAGLEAVSGAIARRLLDANPALSCVVVSAQARRWQRIGAHSFAVERWLATAQARASRGEPVVLRGGVRGVELLTTTGSGFTGFMRDDLTTQTEAADRPLWGTLDADWGFASGSVGEPAAGLIDQVHGWLTAAFADRPSNAVQQLLTEVGGEVLRRCDELASIALHFESFSVAPIPPELAAAGGGRAHELGVGAVGVTDVVVRRA